mmetsp:Transcript_4747/g.21667  ORF Transcript_4747/g.21667 Transcript_4747/m.21667 type:complete len:205 (+) Transcript_4747:1875-2489(+)
MRRQEPVAGPFAPRRRPIRAQPRDDDRAVDALKVSRETRGVHVARVDARYRVDREPLGIQREVRAQVTEVERVREEGFRSVAAADGRVAASSPTAAADAPGRISIRRHRADAPRVRAPPRAPGEPKIPAHRAQRRRLPQVLVVRESPRGAAATRQARQRVGADALVVVVVAAGEHAQDERIVERRERAESVAFSPRRRGSLLGR